VNTMENFLGTARTEIGYRESGDNRTKYGNWYGMDGEPWCAMFVSWCADRCGLLDSAVPKFAYTPSGYRWYEDRGRAGRDPRPGSLVFFQFPGMGRICHVGLVEAVLPDGRIQTIEGNTDADGSRTGGGVWRKRRSTRTVVGYGHPNFEEEDDMTPEEKLRLANVERMLENLLGQFGWTESAPDTRDFAWRGVEAWDLPEGQRRKLTLLDLLRESHRELTTRFPGRDEVPTQDTLVGHVLDLARDGARVLRKTGA
jgi:hypothetical protein